MEGQSLRSQPMTEENGESEVSTNGGRKLGVLPDRRTEVSTNRGRQLGVLPDERTKKSHDNGDNENVESCPDIGTQIFSNHGIPTIVTIQ